MNTDLRERHFADISDERAQDMYDRLCAACDAREGGIGDAEQMLIADFARAEQIKQMLIADIEKRGLGWEKRNGRQTYYQKNDSVAQLRAYAEQQRKLLNELRLTPSSRKDPIVSMDDGFDAF